MYAPGFTVVGGDANENQVRSETFELDSHLIERRIFDVDVTRRKNKFGLTFRAMSLIRDDETVARTADLPIHSENERARHDESFEG